MLLLLQAGLKMVRLLLVDWEGSEASPGGSESAQGWHCSKQGWHWPVQGWLRFMPSALPMQHGQ